MRRIFIRILQKILRVWHKLLPTAKTIGVRALVIEGDKILLVKHTYMDGWYSIGGGVEKGESPIQALKRELMEEVGVEVLHSPKIFGAYHNNAEGRDDYVVLYICERFKQTKPSQSFEIQEMRWFALDDLPEDLSPGTKRRLEEYRDKREVSEVW